MFMILFEAIALTMLLMPLAVAYFVIGRIEAIKSKKNQLICALFAVEMSVAILFGWFPVGTLSA